MDFTPTLSRNPQLDKSMQVFATQLAYAELFPERDDINFDELGPEAVNMFFDMIADMERDSFYVMLDAMRDTMKEYKPYIIEAMEE